MPRTARYAVLGDPGAAAETWFVLHGYGQRADWFIRRFGSLPGLSEGRRAVVAPEALSRFYVEREIGPHGPESRVGASWMTRGEREHEIRDYVEYLDRVAETVLDAVPGSAGGVAVEPPAIDGGGRRLVALGFSQGSQTASRWVTYGRIRPAELVLWGGGLAADLERAQALEALGRIRVALVVGDEDEWGGRVAAESRERLTEWGVAFEHVTFAGGHRVEPEVLSRRWPG